MKAHLERVRFMTHILDTRFSILGFKFGIDPLLSIIPSLGSIIGSATSIYLFWIGWKGSLPRELQTKMLVNIIIDFVLGSIPVAGVVFDAFYKANLRNLKIIEEYFHVREIN